MNIKWTRWGHITAIILVAGLEGACQYLDPAHFNFGLALGAFLIASAIAAANYLNSSSMERRVKVVEGSLATLRLSMGHDDGPPTGTMRAAQPPSEDYR